MNNEDRVMNHLIPLVLALVFASCAAQAADAVAPGNIEAGATKSAVCGGCHGPNGISVNPLWPNLAGQHALYLEKQIKAFRDGARVEPTMQPFVATLTDAEIVDIAAYFASRRACP
jgi:cytochrome c553